MVTNSRVTTLCTGRHRKNLPQRHASAASAGDQQRDELLCEAQQLLI
jgi:hypothetical protein